jgi:hypothetical protein
MGHALSLHQAEGSTQPRDLLAVCAHPAAPDPDVPSLIGSDHNPAADFAGRARRIAAQG